MIEDHLHWLDQIRTTHRPSVGDKVFYLSLLAQRGYPTLPGIVVSAVVFQRFLEQVKWTDPMFADLPHSSLHVDVENPRQLQAVAQQIRTAIQSALLPDAWLDQLEQAVAVWQSPALIFRPSIALSSTLDPTVSLKTTGLLEAQVCQVERSAIAKSLKRAWAELFRARSLLYWQRLNIHLQRIHLAVLVQPIQSAIAAGDVQVQEAQLSIRAIWGLGKGFTQGEVPPDCYSINLQTGEQSSRLSSKPYRYQIAIDAANPGLFAAAACPYQVQAVDSPQQMQAALTGEQLQTLSKLAQQTASELGTLLQLEWTLTENGNAQPQFYLTQVIPYLAMQRWNNDSNQPLQATIAPQPISAEGSATSSLLKGLAAAPGRTQATAWVVKQGAFPQTGVPSNTVLVAAHITPDWLPWIKQAMGVITEQGGMTSHGAVLAREIGIPAVTGLINATSIIQTGEKLWVDGDRGEVQRVAEPDAEIKEPISIDSAQSSSAQSSEQSNSLAIASDATPLPAQPTTATQIFVTLSQPEALPKVKHLPVDGVGLLRSELMMLETLEQRHPQQWLQNNQQGELSQRLAEQICQFTQAFAPRPVFYRSSDLRSHEFAHLQGTQANPELNPILGQHGTFSYQQDPALFQVELAALKQVQQAGYSNLRLILPFVRTVEEFRFCQQQVQQTGLNDNPQFQLWIMAEVPSVLLLLPDYIQAGVQGVAIGSNDLTQLLLGVDRDHPQMAPAFNQRHPAVMRAIEQIIQVTQQANIPCSICGQAPGQHPEIIDALIEWGITAISVAPDQVETVYRAIGRAEQRLLLQAARQTLASTSRLRWATADAPPKTPPQTPSP
ncbi:MAG: phosphoenolpyruvate synthase [Elainellaceae cyanobacterium]